MREIRRKTIFYFGFRFFFFTANMRKAKVSEHVAEAIIGFIFEKMPTKWFYVIV